MLHERVEVYITIETVHVDIQEPPSLSITFTTSLKDIKYLKTIDMKYLILLSALVALAIATPISISTDPSPAQICTKICAENPSILKCEDDWVSCLAILWQE
jgi:hypothetical protein